MYRLLFLDAFAFRFNCHFHGEYLHNISSLHVRRYTSSKVKTACSDAMANFLRNLKVCIAI